MAGSCSVNLDSGVDPTNERIGSVESNGAGQQPEREDHQSRVTKVQQRWDEFRYFQLQAARVQTSGTTFSGNFLGRFLRLGKDAHFQKLFGWKDL